jgi:hypothetical protein
MRVSLRVEASKKNMMKNEGNLKWCDAVTCFILEYDNNLHEHLTVI